jgi:hypothetical protein
LEYFINGIKAKTCLPYPTHSQNSSNDLDSDPASQGYRFENSIKKYLWALNSILILIYMSRRKITPYVYGGLIYTQYNGCF